MMRSSRGVLLACFCVSTSTPSSSRRASSSSVNLDTCCLGPHAGKEGHALGHALFPSVGRCNREQPATLLLEFQGPLGEFPRVLDCEIDAFAGDHGLDWIPARVT